MTIKKQGSTSAQYSRHFYPDYTDMLGNLEQYGRKRVASTSKVKIYTLNISLILLQLLR